MKIEACRHLADAVCDFAEGRRLESHSELYRRAKDEGQRVALHGEGVEEVGRVCIAKSEESFLLAVHVMENRDGIFRVDSKQAFLSGHSKNVRYICVTITSLDRFI